MNIAKIKNRIFKLKFFQSRLYKKVTKYLKKYKDMTQYYDVSIFAASIVFNLLTVFVPLFMIFSELLSSLYQSNIDFFQKHFSPDTLSLISSLVITKMPKGMTLFATVLFAVNLLWITSKLMTTLNRISDLVYVEVKDRPSLKLRIRSFVMMFFSILLIFADFVATVSLSYVISFLYKNSVIHYQFVTILFTDILPFLINFMGIAILVIMLYKYLIPIKISFRKVYLSSFLVTVVCYILTVVLRISFSLSKNTTVIYGTFSNLYMILIWLYSISYVFILGIIYNYYLYLRAGKKRDE